MLFTIGHSNHDYASFFLLLAEYRIETIIDVRSHPYSQFIPHFNRESLKAEAERRGVEYVFQGDVLGGRPSDGKGGSDKPDYERMASNPALLRSLALAVKTGESRRAVLMCSEGDPTRCHRALLLGRVVEARLDARVRHITPGGLIDQGTLLPDQLSLL